MEFIQDFELKNNNYTSKIKDSKYIEGHQQVIKKGVNDICEIIIGNNEIDYESIDKKQKSQFITSKKIQIASDIKLNDNYISGFSESLIQNGLQKINTLSSILYLNEYYKIKCIIHNQDTNKYYQTTLKNYEPLLCIYKDGTWSIGSNDLLNSEYSDINDLKNILNIDIDWNIFKPYLKNINKYKIKELEEIANELNISMKGENGKKKLKKDIYNEINLKHFTQDI